MKTLFRSAPENKNSSKFVWKEKSVWDEVVGSVVGESFQTSTSQIEDLNKLIALLKGDNTPENVKESYKDVSPLKLMNSIVQLVDTLTQSVILEIQKNPDVLSEETSTKVESILEELGNIEPRDKEKIQSVHGWLNEISKQLSEMQPFLENMDSQKIEKFVELATAFVRIIKSEKSFVEVLREMVDESKKPYPVSIDQFEIR